MMKRNKTKSRVWEIYKHGSVRGIDVFRNKEYNISTRRAPRGAHKSAG
jgi:hypothetical protein